MKAHSSEAQRRKYIRLDTVFPVQFRLISAEGAHFLSGWHQGFTNNIGRGGLCLAVNNLSPELANAVKEHRAKISLDIEIPFLKIPVNAQAKVSWVKELPGHHNYLIGLNYEEIDPLQNKRIMRYAWIKKLSVPVAISVICVLALAFLVNGFIAMKLTKGNRALVEQLVKIAQDSSITKQKIKKLSKDRQDLQIKIQALEQRIQAVSLEKEKSKEGGKIDEIIQANKIKELSSTIERLGKEKDSLEAQLIAVQLNENTVTEDFLRLDKRKASLEKANFDKMYQWLKIHQNPRSGLVMSFEGDEGLKNWAFIYDQALVAGAYVNFADFERARRILDFFYARAQRVKGLFVNAYYVDDGSPAEYIVHSGPNIWVGIAAAQYSKRAQDDTYLALAEEIAGKIMELQNQDKDGGIRGGPELNWYSTEHNLDAYALFTMLSKITGKPQYQQAANKALDWLLEHTYDYSGAPVKRGKGDSTIATDTYAWSIAAIGPEKLEALGMNPEKIIEFAEENCCTEAAFSRPEGRVVRVKGFDFSPQKNLARGGIVSTEWTAQMIMAFKIMSEYYYKKGMVAKSRAYGLKADEYLSELGSMVIASPSPSGQGESCLPYATQGSVDTGHGWKTPKGNSTGSVAGTAYALFAYYSFNPLEIKD